MATPDITIIGAGVFGLSIAYTCAQRGAKIQVIDQTGVGAGSSGGIVGALAPHTPDNWNAKKQFQLESLLLSQSYWPEIESISGISSGYGRHGRLQAIEGDRALELAYERINGAKVFWHDQAKWDVVSGQGDWHPASPSGQLVFDTLSARIHPKRACDSLAAALIELGTNIKIGDHDPGTGPVIWATGHQGLKELSHKLGKPVGIGVKGQSMALDFAAPKEAPQLFANGIHIVPHSDGTVAIGSTSEREYDDGSTTDAQLDALHQRALAICPILESARIVQRWAGIRPRSKSRAPMLGHWPGRPEHFIANGGFKIGFGMAPKVAQVMADLVLDRRDSIPRGFRVEDSL